MIADLTPTQMAVVGYLRQFLAEQDQLPPTTSIAKHFGWASPNAAHDVMRALEKRGVIEKNAVGRYRFARAVEA